MSNFAKDLRTVLVVSQVSQQVARLFDVATKSMGIYHPQVKQSDCRTEESNRQPSNDLINQREFMAAQRLVCDNQVMNTIFNFSYLSHYKVLENRDLIFIK